MSERLSFRTRMVFAVSITLSTLLVHTFNPILRLIYFVSAFVNMRASVWLATPIALILVAALVFGVLSTKIGSYLYLLWTKIEERVAHILPYEPDRQIYAQRDRERTLQRHMLQSLHRSDFMYAVLVSGYAMTHRDEKFIRAELGKLPYDELMTKRLRFLFLNPESPHWQHRAEWLVNNRADLNHSGVAGYLTACEGIIRDLRALPCAPQIAHYNSAPGWRLYMFSDKIYVSRYLAPPEAYWEEGHRTVVVAYPRNDAMYDWLFQEFKRLAPPPWLQEMAH